MRIFAIDLGDQRTGLALADRITSIASPAGLIEIPIDREDGRLLITEIVKQFHRQASGPETEIILGLPLNMDNTEGPRAKLVREFATKLASRIIMHSLLISVRMYSEPVHPPDSRTPMRLRYCSKWATQTDRPHFRGTQTKRNQAEWLIPRPKPSGDPAPDGPGALDSWPRRPSRPSPQRSPASHPRRDRAAA